MAYIFHPSFKSGVAMWLTSGQWDRNSYCMDRPGRFTKSSWLSWEMVSFLLSFSLYASFRYDSWHGAVSNCSLIERSDPGVGGSDKTPWFDHVIGIRWTRNSLSLEGTEASFKSPQSMIWGWWRPCLLPEANGNSLWRRYIIRSLSLSQLNKEGGNMDENLTSKMQSKTFKNLILHESDWNTDKTVL